MKTRVLSILVVDDDKNIRNTLSASLKAAGHMAETSESVSAATARLKAKDYDVVITDFRMEKETGLDLIKQAKLIRPDIFIIVMTAYASIENAVSVVKEGAYDYLPKPFSNAQLSHVLDKLGAFIQLRHENEELKKYRYRRDYFAGMTSPAMQKLEEFVKKVAPTNSTVLLSGESGTGKSELAKLTHELSPRKGKPFVSVYCTTIVESLLESELFGHVAGAYTGATGNKAGKFELAAGGTLFLDEIGDLSASAQTKLLRFLQDRVVERVGSNEEIIVDTRIIVATNKNLPEAVKEGKFREDLYFRVNMLEYPLAPLRHRKEDVPILIQKFLTEAKASANLKEAISLPEGVMDKLLSYPWPGNVRELRNAIERLTILANLRPATIDDLPESVRNPGQVSFASTGGAFLSLEALEKEHIQKVLSVEANLERAATILGITSVTLWRKRKQYGMA